MARNNKSKRSKLIWAPIILLVVLAIFACSILYNGEVVVEKTASTNVIQELEKDILLKSGQFAINQENMNALINLYFKKPISKGDITIKEINTKIGNDKILIEAPFSYKNINLLLSSTGKLDVSNGEITYVADNFKVGKLTLPKELIMSQIAKQSNDVFYVEDNLIKIKTDILPIKIKSFVIRNHKIIGTVGFKETKTQSEGLDTTSDEDIDKELVAAKQKIQSATKYMNETQKEQANNILSTIEEVKGKSIEQKKEVLNYINSIIDEVTN
ncbi:hypothetical protein KTC92_15170 [Clostridium sp. CM027]|uniref:hypothetical protein n=1 Tax=Clostridium sp. CM027 TaxID=2849865 RepID=UPI001C6E42BB|nr:hypothetical protein [Clostridium sp. CM027]MBW9144808.1 hypothetical protein [Clostridium sp. CM027]UVE40445.1 hypothetical protein KTC92_15170 [Clostridium sp. CM027]